MNKNMFSRIAISTVALFLATFAFAIPKGPCESKEPPPCCEKPAPGPYAFSYMKDKGLNCPSNVYIYGDFLWMMASEQGLDYAMEHDSGATTLTNGELHGFSAPNDSWDWNPGARIVIGTFTDEKEWNLEASWMYLHIANDDATSVPTNKLAALWLPNQAQYTDASARWKATYNTIDLKLGKPYHLNRYFTMNPSIGVRGAWIEQDFLARYSDSTNAAAYASTDMTADNDYWGVGLRAGFDAEWIFNKNFNLFGHIAGSLLYGKFDIDQKAPGVTTPSEIASPAYKIHQEYYEVSPNLDVIFGAIWGKYFNNEKYKVSLKIAYEFHHWWDQNNMRRFLHTSSPAINEEDVVSRGNLSLSGFAFSLLFDF